MARRSIRLRFAGSHGSELDARLELPSGKPLAFALFAHCFTCTKDIFPVARISRALAERGIAVLRFDFTGLGGSAGEFAETNFTSNVADLVAAAEFLGREYEAPALLIGHSLGGAAVLAAAARIASARAVCTINAPREPAHVRQHLGAAEDEIRSRGEAEVEIAGRPFTVRRQFLEDIDAHDLEPAIARLGKALLVLHAPEDGIVAVDHGHRIFAAAAHPKSFVALDGADHLLSRHADAAYAATTIAAWAERHVPSRRAQDDAVDPLPAGTVVVREVGPGRYSQEVRIGRHTMAADEPTSHGGDDTGPSPHEYLLAGLGACTAITLRMYAERKEWPLEGVTVQLTRDRSGKVDAVRRVITLSGDLGDEQRARLLEIANRCPVHRALASGVAVRTELEEG